MRNLISEVQSGSLNLTQNFVLDDLTNLAFIKKSDGDALSILAGRSIDEHMAAFHADGQVEYSINDAINSAVATVDQTGAQLVSLFYEPFGQTTTKSRYPYQFAGRMPVTSNLYYYRARYYNSAMSRFVSEDPLGFAGGDMNLYRYVFNSPQTSVDPVGLAGPIDRMEQFARDEGDELFREGNHLGAFLDYYAAALLQVVSPFAGAVGALNTILDPCASLFDKIMDSTLESVGIGAGWVVETKAPRWLLYFGLRGRGLSRSRMVSAAWGRHHAITLGNDFLTGYGIAKGLSNSSKTSQGCGCNQ